MDRRWAQMDRSADDAAPATPAHQGVDPLGLSAMGQALELQQADPGAVARSGVAGSGGPVPHGAVIQHAFGHHDIGGVTAHVGGAAAAAAHTLGAQAYATEQSLAFAEQPDLHTAAHEAAHAVQQRDAGGGAVAAHGGFGSPGDAHERHADAVADAVVAGRSAEGLLDARPAGPPGVQLKEQNQGRKQPKKKRTLAEKVAAYGDRLTREASSAVDEGIGAQQDAPVPPTLGRTVLPDPESGALMALKPHLLGELADLVVGGRSAAAQGAAEHLRGEAWSAVDPLGQATRVVLPGEQVRFCGPGADAGPLPLVGRGEGSTKGKYDAIKFQTAAVPYGEANMAWAAERQRQQQNADGQALGLSIAAMQQRQPFAAYSIAVELPGMAAGRPLYIYNFPKSAYDAVVSHGDLGGTDELALRTAVIDAGGTAGIPPVRGTRILTFQALKPEEIGAWVERVDAADKAEVEAQVKEKLEQDGVAGVADLSEREILQASPARQIQLVRRIVAGTASGDAPGKALMETVLLAMSPSTFKAMCEVFVGDGTMNTFGFWVDGDARLMWVFGDQLMAANIIGDRTVGTVDAEGNDRLEAQGCMLWVGDNPTWGGASKHITFAGQECTVQVGDKGIFGALADEARSIHGLWKKNTEGGKQYRAGAFMSGVVDFFAEAGIGTLDMLDRPAEVANALYMLASEPGLVFEAIEKSIGEEWDALLDAAHKAEYGGDATEYYYLSGKWASAIATAISGVVGIGKGVAKGVKTLAKLSPRNISLYLRTLLIKGGRLRNIGRGKVQGFYNQLRANKAFMRRVGADAAKLDGTLLEARQARTLADEAQAALASADDVKQARKLADGAAKKAVAAERRVSVQRAYMGATMRSQGVVGAEVMRAEDLVRFAKALANDKYDAQKLAKMRHELLRNLAGTVDLDDPVAFATAVNNQASILKKGKKKPEVADPAREKLRAMFEANDFEGISELNDKDLVSFSNKFNPKALDSKLKPVRDKMGDLWGLDDVDEIARKLDEVATLLDKQGFADGARTVRTWIVQDRQWGYFGVHENLDDLLKRLPGEMVGSQITKGRGDLRNLRLNLLAKNKKLDQKQMREALTKAMNEKGLLGQHGSKNAKIGLDEMSNRAFVDQLPDDVVDRLFQQLRDGKVEAFSEGIANAKMQGLDQTLGRIKQIKTQRKNPHVKILPGQNVATAEIDIPGVEIERRLVGVSGKDSPPGTVTPPDKRVFRTTTVGHDRLNDSEAKILEAVAQKLGDNHGVKGSITLVSERPCCPSCMGVIQQFRQRYPNIALKVDAGL